MRASAGAPPAVARGGGERTERLADPGVLLGERGQDAVPDAGAREARIGVRRILDERNAAPPEVAQDLRAGDVQQRAHEDVAPVRNARQAADAGAADDPIEDGLGLVVRLMPQRHPVGPVRAGQLVERPQARVARRVLQGGPAAPPPFRRDVDRHGRERQPERLRPLAHQLHLAGGVGAQAVIDGGHLQREAQPRAQLPQHVQQRHRIGTAGDGDDHAVARTQQLVVSDGGEDGRQHVEPASLAL